MNTLQIVSTVLSMLCLVITTVLAWIMLNKTNKTEVSFSGTPVDKKEFEQHQQQNREEHEKIFTRFETVHSRINPIESDISVLCQASGITTTRLIQMEAKIDRLIERTK